MGTAGSRAMSGDLWGAVLAVVAAILSNIGTNAQKHSHLIEDQRPPSQRRPYLKRPFWWVGFAGVLMAAIGDFLALAFASQALVAALGGGSTLLTNIVVARVWNGDKLVKTDALGVAMIIAGATYFAFEQDTKEVDDMSEIKANFTKKWFLVYLVGQVLIIFIFLAGIANSFAYTLRISWTETLFSPLVQRLDEQNERINHLERIVHEKLSHPDDQTCNTPGGSPLPALVAQVDLPRIPNLKWYDKYTYAACAGAIGGLSVLFGSCTGKSLSCSTCSFEDAFGHPYFYGYLTSMLVCVIVQTHLLNKAMQLGGTMSVFPVFEAFWISFGVIGGLVFYNDSSISWSDDFKQGAGVFFMLIGVAFLLLHPESEADRNHRQAREQHHATLTESLQAFDRGTRDSDLTPMAGPNV